MQDHAQSLETNSKTTLLLRDETPSFSFIANFQENRGLIEKSILSIEDIGDELGLNYEIILPVDGHSGNIHLYSDLERKVENLRLLRFRHKNTGLQKRIMQSNSFGSFVVLFDPSRTYGIEFADLLHSFAARRDEVVLFSDLVVIPSVIFRRIGTWRDLRSAEDLDILARIASVTALIAYNPPGFDIRVPSNEPLIFRMGRIPASIRKLREMILMQRDQIVGSGYRLEDIMTFYRIGKNRRFFRLLLTLYSFVLSRVWRLKPFRGEDSNNYSGVMDKLLESLILADFRRYPDFNQAPRICIPENDLRYLRQSGKVWGRVVEDINTYVSKPVPETPD